MDLSPPAVRPLIRQVIIMALILSLPRINHAHILPAFAGNDNPGTVPGAPLSTAELWRAWAFDPGIMIGLSFAAGMYTRGIGNLWRATHTGAGISRREATWYACGWFALFVALVSPLHPWGEALFSAHMTQHEILMIIAAPLLVMGRPSLAFLWALPVRWRRAVGRLASVSWWRRPWHLFTGGSVAWATHAAVLWVWHYSPWFQATLTNDFIHSMQHMSFLGSAILFWWAVIHGRKRALGYGMAVLYLFTTAIHTSVLGALLTFSSRVWYPAYTVSAQAWGLSALEDQQIGGLIMWVPASLTYIIAALILFSAWLRESDRRAVAHQAATNKTVVIPPAPSVGGTNCEAGAVL